MDNTRKLNRRYETIAWGTLLIWVGARDLMPGLPTGTGMLGIGLILLGLNLARRLYDIPINGVLDCPWNNSAPGGHGGAIPLTARSSG